MEIPLSGFEEFIEPKILKRGLSYFKQGFVNEPSEMSPGVYEFIVEGSEDYTVELTIKNNLIQDQICDCPYDFGPVCKHMAAAIFYLQQDTLELGNQKKKKRGTRKKSVKRQVEDILNTVTHDELKQFTVEVINSDKQFRNFFLATFSHYNDAHSKEFYQSQIRSILNLASGRDGFISWSDMSFVVAGIEPFFDHTAKYLENKNYRNAIFICMALIEEVTGAFQYADDSSGDLGGVIYRCMETLSDIADQDIPDEIRTELLDYCISTYKGRVFAGWDWHTDILYIAKDLLKNETEGDRLLNCLENTQSGYEQEQAQFVVLDVLKRFKDEREVELFIEQNMSNPRIRRIEIEQAINKENYSRAIKLSKEGIKNDEKEKPGLAKEWYDWLLKVAQAQNDKQKIIEYARYLLIDNFRHEQDYYQILKSNIAESDWHLFVEGLLEDIEASSNWMNKVLIRQIYIQEEWWERLFELLKSDISLDRLEREEEYLLNDYREEFVQLYSKEISIFLTDNMGRKYYQDACRYLRRMKKIGGGEQVKTLVKNFREKYSKRKALMDELNKV